MSANDRERANEGMNQESSLPVEDLDATKRRRIGSGGGQRRHSNHQEDRLQFTATVRQFARFELTKGSVSLAWTMVRSR